VKDYYEVSVKLSDDERKELKRALSFLLNESGLTTKRRKAIIALWEKFDLDVT
jgi:hypothetical protein